MEDALLLLKSHILLDQRMAKLSLLENNKASSDHCLPYLHLKHILDLLLEIQGHGQNLGGNQGPQVRAHLPLGGKGMLLLQGPLVLVHHLPGGKGMLHRQCTLTPGVCQIQHRRHIQVSRLKKGRHVENLSHLAHPVEVQELNLLSFKRHIYVGDVRSLFLSFGFVFEV